MCSLEPSSTQTMRLRLILISGVRLEKQVSIIGYCLEKSVLERTTGSTFKLMIETSSNQTISLEAQLLI